MVDLPAALRRALPPEAQRLYRLAYREARDAGLEEDAARTAAQEAVEERFRKVGDRWEPRTPAPTHGPPYGEAAIARLVAGARFPCTSGQLVRALGDPVVEIAEAQPMPLAEILDLAEEGYWRDAHHLLEAVHRAWGRVRTRWHRDHGKEAPAAP